MFKYFSEFTCIYTQREATQKLEEEVYNIIFSVRSFILSIQRLRIPNVRLEIERQSTIFQACKLFNELPPYLINPMSKYMYNRNILVLVKIPILLNLS